jgi:RNase P/RNase MRP subunit p29
MIGKQEFIGKDAQITYNCRVFEGKVIDETKNMIVLKTEKKIIKIIKKNAIIKFGNERIDGKDITKRPEERIKAC